VRPTTRRSEEMNGNKEGFWEDRMHWKWHCEVTFNKHRNMLLC